MKKYFVSGHDAELHEGIAPESEAFDYVYFASDVEARIAELEKYKIAVELHNAECDGRCQDAASCGYRQYFVANGWRCPTCPVYEKINLYREESL